MGSVIINGGATMSLVSHTLSLSGTPTPLTINGTFTTVPSPGDGTITVLANAPESVGGTGSLMAPPRRMPLALPIPD